jgi:Mg2+ and Co2+ transporter CorA
VTIFLVDDHTVISIQKSPSQLNDLLLSRIVYAGSKIRLNGPKFLLYSIIDTIVDELFPVMRMYRKKVRPARPT